MVEFLGTTTAQLVIALAVLAALLAVGGYVVALCRRGIYGGGEPATSELISNFRDLYSRGDLSEEEYRTIKSNLAARFQQELDWQPEETGHEQNSQSSSRKEQVQGN